MAWASFTLSTFILAAGVVNDLAQRKVKNSLVLALAALGLAGSVLIHGGLPGLYQALLAAGAAFLISTPLYLARIFGGGDLKLIVAFSLTTPWQTAAAVIFLSLFWGAVLGLFRALLSGQLKILLFSTLSVARRRGTISEDLHRIPYSVALLLGWLTQNTLSKMPEGVLW